MAKAPLKNNDDDFELNQIVKAVGNHAGDISLIKSRIEILESKFGNNEQIAETLYDTSIKATKMQEMLSCMFIKLLKNDESTKEELKQAINKIDREYTAMIFKRIGKTGYSIMMIAIGAIITYFIRGNH